LWRVERCILQALTMVSVLAERRRDWRCRGLAGTLVFGSHEIPG